jgi:hypothetical protein
MKERLISGIFDWRMGAYHLRPAGAAPGNLGLEAWLHMESNQDSSSSSSSLSSSLSSRLSPFKNPRASRAKAPEPEEFVPEAPEIAPGPDSFADLQAAFLHFIKYGILPFHSKEWNLEHVQDQLLEKIRKESHFFGSSVSGNTFCHKLLEVLVETPHALPRLLAQFGDALLEDLYAHTMESGMVSRWISWFGGPLVTDLKLLRWKTVLLALSYTRGRLSLETYSRFETGILLYLLHQLGSKHLNYWIAHLEEYRLEKLMSTLDLPYVRGISREGVGPRIQVMMRQFTLPVQSGTQLMGYALLPDKSEGLMPVPDSLYVGNAGLILLQPFLQVLFEQNGWLCGDVWLEDQYQQKAVLLMQHLVHPDELHPEYLLPLNKILCGYPLSAHLPLHFDEECRGLDELLEDIIHRWTLNGVPVNSSVQSFRESFLQRKGKLVSRGKDWVLQVEQKAFDVIALNGLPWNIRLLHLPWMNQSLWVEWV